MILCALKKYENVFENQLKAQRIYRELEILSQLQACDQIMGLYEAIEDINEDTSDFYLVLKYMPCDLKRVSSSLFWVIWTKFDLIFRPLSVKY